MSYIGDLGLPSNGNLISSPSQTPLTAFSSLATDANGQITTLSAGLAGQVLTSVGLGTIPSFQNSSSVTWTTTIPILPATASINTAYAAISSGTNVILLLPASPSIGNTVSILLAGASKWQVIPNTAASQSIAFGDMGTSISLNSSSQGDFVQLTYVYSGIWFVTASVGNIILT